jgi:hypothetical protein
MGVNIILLFEVISVTNTDDSTRDFADKLLPVYFSLMLRYVREPCFH